MAAADQILKNLNLFADGYGYAGNVTEFQPPALKIKEEEYRAGGLDAPISIDMGMEKLECSFTLSSFNPAVFSLWGLFSSTKQFTARGAVQSYNGAVQPVTIAMTGNLRQIDPGAWKPGEKTENKFTVALLSYTFTLNGVVVHDIDILNMKRVINGVDQLAAQRAAIGI